jgi:hypothetical protein
MNQLPDPPPVVISLAVLPDYVQAGTIWAGILEDGVYLSTRRGQRWAVWNFGLLAPHVLGVFIFPNFGHPILGRIKQCLPAPSRKDYYSEDQGNSWVRLFCWL